MQTEASSLEVETTNQMKKTHQKILGLFLLILFGMGNTSWAQSDKMMFHGGFAYNFVTKRPEFQPAGSQQIFYLYGLTAGMNYVLAHSNDQVSVSVNPNVNLGFTFYQSGLGFLGQVPVFMLARLGAKATPYNESRFGIGAGLGCNFSYWYTSSLNFNQINQAFYNPSALAELNIKGRSSDYSIRFNWSLYRPKAEMDGVKYELGTTALSIVYSF
jgi:hypothetical protein